MRGIKSGRYQTKAFKSSPKNPLPQEWVFDILIVMSEWSNKRQSTVGGILFLVILLFGLFLFFKNKEAPTCFDGELNQSEEGIDCGGECVAVCQFKAEDIAILWSRVVPVADDVYSVVAMIENPNPDYEANNVPYTFKLYDDRNILIYERKGEGYFLPGSTFPVFEHALRTGQRTPWRASFELRGVPYWEASDADEINIKIVTKVLDDKISAPRLTSVIKNETFEILSDIEFVALLFDEEGNLVNSSKTILERLAPEESDTIVFTWPKDFGVVISRIEIVPVYFKR